MKMKTGNGFRSPREPTWSMSLSGDNPKAIRKMVRRTARSNIWSVPKIASSLPDFSVPGSGESSWKTFFKNTTRIKWSPRQLSVVLCRISQRRSHYCGLVSKIHLMANRVLSCTPDNYDEAAKDAEEVLGASLCGVETRLGLAHFHEGRLKNKEVKASIEDLLGGDELLGYILYYLSIKAELNFDHKAYASLIDDSFKNANDDSALFVRSWLLPWDRKSLTRKINASSLMGIYGFDLLVYLARNLFGAFDKNNDFIAEIQSLSDCVGGRFANDAIEIICRSRGLLSEGVFDLYTLGKYDEAIKQCSALLKTNAWRLDLLEILMRSNMRLGKVTDNIFPEKSIGASIFTMMRDILSGERSQYDQREHLLSMANAFSCLPFSPIIVSMCHRMFGSFDRAVSDEIIRSASFMLPVDNPYSAQPNPRKDEFINPITRHCRTGTPCELSANKHKIPEYRLKRILALAYNRSGEWEMSRKALEGQMRSGESYLCLSDEFRIRSLALSRSSSDDLPEYFSVNYIKNNSFVYLVDVPSLLAAIRGSRSRDAEFHMHAAISLHAISKHVSSIRNVQEDIKQTVIRWWIALSCQIPSDLVGSGEKTAVHVYFYENILKVESIDGLWCYGSSDQAMEDRIKILVRLLELNQDKSAIYKDEINSIYQKLAIQSGLNTINKSKITLDRASLAARISAAISTHYTRAISMPTSEDARVELIVKHVKKAMEAASAQGKSAVVLVVPESERSEQIAKIVSLARDEFAWSNELGLNSYISMNIRHGTLEGQLRGVFMRHHLVTQKDSASGGYLLNTHWENQIQQVSPMSWPAMSKSLDDCSRELDDIIQKIKKQFIQIKTEDKNKDGLIELLVDDQMADSAAALIDNRVSVDLFSERFLEILSSSTNKQLAKTADFLKTNVLSLFSDIMDKLERGIVGNDEFLVAPRVVQSMKSSISAARTEVANELNLIASWLSISDRAEMSDYNQDLAINVVNKMLAAGRMTGDAGYISFDKVSTPIPGSTFVPLTNILFILADNAIKHSGLSLVDLRLSAGVVCVNTGHEKWKIDIWLSNNRGANDASLQALSQCIRDAVDTGDLALAGREGGTGIQKIVRTAKYDMKASISINVNSDHKSTITKICIEGVSP